MTDTAATRALGSERAYLEQLRRHALAANRPELAALYCAELEELDAALKTLEDAREPHAA